MRTPFALIHERPYVISFEAIVFPIETLVEVPEPLVIESKHGHRAFLLPFQQSVDVGILPAHPENALARSGGATDAAYAVLHVGVDPGKYVRVTVTDTGEGMDRGTRERLFEPFFTTKEDGTGLGLATAYGIIKQSDGHIWVYSEPGAGTTFHLLFPIVTTPLDLLALDFVGETADLTGTETILVVEDEQRVRELIDQVLTGYGYLVLTAGTPEEAIRIAASRSEPIELILSDVMLPGRRGPELVHELQQIHPEARCVFSSGYAHRSRGEQDLLPDQPFLAKPYTAVELASKIRETLNSVSMPIPSPAR